jgi:hypothetical protein
VTGGPWKPTSMRYDRRLDLSHWLAVYLIEDGRWRWRVSAGKAEPLAQGHADSFEEAREAADLWASENGYPAVRVEVDP